MNIAIVCDFFYPRLGGVEMHIVSLAYSLRQLGHKIIIITHAYECEDDKQSDDASCRSDNTNHASTTRKQRKSKRTGVRYLPGPIKVYHCPILPMTDQVALPTFLATFPLLRWIFLRENIEIVHSHQATSVMGNEAVTYAAEMGLASVYTDHSLFAFQDIASIVLNRVMKTTLSTVGAAICVSQTCRENLIMRAKLDPSIVHAIPNAIDSSKFTPDPSQRSKDRIKIVTINRLVFRKGIDLLVGIIPLICKQYPNVDFIIGGDGNKRFKLDEMIEREQLHDRVEFLGFVPHSSVRDVLVRGHIFLNCSLTESFCIAILEAACSGLFVVSTNVGGVPEVLPEDMTYLAKPSTEALVEGLSVVLREKFGTGVGGDGNSTMVTGEIKTAFNPFDFHERLKDKYSWKNIALRTVSVYEEVLAKSRLTFLERLERYRSIGTFAGVVGCLLCLTLHFYVRIVEWWQPRHLIDVVPDLVESSVLDKNKNNVNK